MLKITTYFFIWNKRVYSFIWHLRVPGKFGFNKCFLQAQALLCWPLNEGRLPGDHNWCLCANFKITWNAHQDQRRHWRSWFDWYDSKYFLLIFWFWILVPNSWTIFAPSKWYPKSLSWTINPSIGNDRILVAFNIM